MKSYEIVSLVLKTLKKEAKVGVELQYLNTLAEAIVTDNGGICVNKGYQAPKNVPDKDRPKSPFPNALVINTNSVIAHGIFIDGYKLRHGNIVSFDIGVKKDGLCADAGFTMGIPSVSTRDERLMRYAYRALHEGMKHVRAGANVKDISRAIEQYVVLNGYVVNQRFTGHGIGAEMHMSPAIPNFTYYRQPDYFLKEDEMICIEPIVTYRDRYGMQVNDWSFVTRDGKNSAFYEAQLRVTKDGYEQLTELPEMEPEKSN